MLLHKTMIRRATRGAAAGTVALLLSVAALPASAAEDDTVIVGLVAEPVTFDPTQIGDLNTSRVARRIYEGLTGFVYGTYEIEPRLAESWEISEDGLQYTFKLREGVVFHDGTPFTAEAVKYSYDRQTDPAHPAHGTLTYRYANNYLGNVASIDVLDDHTVRFTLKEPQAPFLQYLTNLTLSIISPAALAEHVDDIARNPSGTGPYKLVEWEPGVKAVLAAHADYHGGAPEIETLVYVPVIESQARLSAISTGEIDLTYDVPVDSLEALRANPEVEVKTGLSAHVWYVVLNTRLSDPPFDNRLVRQAMNHAIDKEAIVDDILQGTGEVSYSPLSPIYGDYHNPDARKYPYDPERARELLAEAGYPDGFDCEFLVPESGSGMQSPVEMGTFIQAYLAQVGIDCAITTMEWGAYLAEYRNSPQMAEMSWNATMGDPDYVMYLLFHSSAHPPAWNAGWYTNETVDVLLSEARVVTDESRRIELYREAQALVAEDAPWIFVNHGQQIVAHSARLKGFELSPNFDFQLENSSLE
jgi:peptide/nickel transport system substrate-binding protein